MFKAKKYIIDHLRLQRIIKKILNFDKKQNVKNMSTIEQMHNHEKNKQEEEKKMTNKKRKKNERRKRTKEN